jgi:hypothetical protein
LATILNFSLPWWTPLIRTSSHLAPRFFVIFSLSEIASVRVPDVSVKPVASKELPLGHVSATCTVSAVGEMVTVSVSASPTVVKLSVLVAVGAAAGPATGGGAEGGSAGGESTIVVQVAVTPVESSIVFVAEPTTPVGLTDSWIVLVR